MTMTPFEELVLTSINYTKRSYLSPEVNDLLRESMSVSDDPDLCASSDAQQSRSIHLDSMRITRLTTCAYARDSTMSTDSLKVCTLELLCYRVNG